MVRRNAWNEERRQAVESLMDAYGPLVLRLMYRLTGSVDAAQALYTEAFLRTYREFIRSRRLIGGKEWIISLCLRVFQLALDTPEQMLETTFQRLGVLPKEQLEEQLRAWKRLKRAELIALLEAADDDSANLEERAGIPQLRLKTSQLLYATVAEVEAEYQHRGPVWTTYGLIFMGALAVVSVGYGVYGLYRTPIKSATVSVATGDKTDTALALPKALQNLPVTVVSQFPVKQSGPVSLDLSHMTIDKGTLYVPSLVSQADTWPSLQVETAALANSGRDLGSVLQKSSQIDLVPPLVSPATTKSGPAAGTVSWMVKKWDFYVTGNWGIAVVDWSPSVGQANEVKQIYALYLPTGKAALATTLTAKAGATNDYVIAVGNGKIVVQSGYKSPNSGSAEVSVSLDVYTLTGSSPSRALDSVKQIPASFGMMVSPVITGDTLVFQGIAGQSDPSNPVNATWYTLGWNGQLSTYAGPPLDGQPHWAVKGQAGTLWWVETTPDMTKRNYVEVLMGQLVAPGSGQQVPAQSLSQSVENVRVTGAYVLWLQSTGNTLQLVVTEAE